MSQLTESQLSLLKELWAVSSAPRTARAYVHEHASACMSFSDEEVRDMYSLYWRQFVQLAYEYIESVPLEVGASFFVKTSVSAFLLGIDVEDRFFEYIDQGAFDEASLQTFYTDIQTQLRQADMLAGSNETLLFSDFYTESNRSNLQTDTVARSEWFVQIGQLLFSKEMIHEDIEIDRTEVITRLVSWVKFFFETIDIVWARERYRDGYLEEVFALESAPQIELLELSFADVKERITTSLQIRDVQQHIVDRFGEPTTWERSNSEIITELGQKAIKLEDSTINSLIIYNESTGTFEWNEELLAS